MMEEQLRNLIQTMLGQIASNQSIGLPELQGAFRNATCQWAEDGLEEILHKFSDEGFIRIEHLQNRSLRIHRGLAFYQWN